MDNDSDYLDDEGEVAPTAVLLKRFAARGEYSLMSDRRVTGRGGAWAPPHEESPATVERKYREEAERCWSHQPHKDTFWQRKFAERKHSLWEDEDGPFDTRGGTEES